jgi:hypothetical protein
MDTSVVTVINLRPGRSENRSSILHRGPPSYAIGTGGFFVGDKVAGTVELYWNSNYILSQITDVLDSLQGTKCQTWKFNIDVRK